MHCKLIALTHVPLRKCLRGISQSFKFCFAFNFEEREKRIQREFTEQLIKMFCYLQFKFSKTHTITNGNIYYSCVNFSNSNI